MVHGGSWNDEPRHVRSATRSGGEPGDRNHNLGFRLAQSARAAECRYPGPACLRTGRVWRAGVHEPSSRPRREGSAE